MLSTINGHVTLFQEKKNIQAKVPPEQGLYHHVMLIGKRQSGDRLESPMRKKVITPAVCTDGNPGKTTTNMPVKILYNFTQHLEEYSLLHKTLSKFQLTHLIIVHFLLESDQNNFVQDRNHEIYSGTISQYLISILSNTLSTEEILVQFPLPKNKKIRYSLNTITCALK